MKIDKGKVTVLYRGGVESWMANNNLLKCCFQSEFVQCSTSKLARIGPGVVRLPWKRSPKHLMWTGQIHVTICFIYQIKETNTMTDNRKKLRASQLNAIRRHVIPARQRTGPCTLTGPRIDREPHGIMGCIVCTGF